MEVYDLLIVGGGAAGMTAALEAGKCRPGSKILLADREEELGGVLCQCIHNGFGSGFFREDMAGTEYAARLRRELEAEEKKNRANGMLTICRSTEVMELSRVKTEKTIPYQAVLSSREGRRSIGFRKLLLASGCRERAIGSLMVSGNRPSGVFGAGQLQKMINLGHYDPGKRALIVGSGDIGCILARRLKCEGKEVVRMIEVLEESPAMERNKRECLDAWHIPVQTRTEVISLQGESRLESVTVLDHRTGKTEEIACDMLVAAAGLIPDRSLLEEAEGALLPEDVFLCGNCRQIHPIADGVSFEARDTVRKIKW